ncbi:unnamed protein product, partial [Cylicostephanus goldi]
RFCPVAVKQSLQSFSASTPSSRLDENSTTRHGGNNLPPRIITNRIDLDRMEAQAKAAKRRAMVSGNLAEFLTY